MLVTRVVGRLEAVNEVERARLRDGPGDVALFAKAFASFACLHAIEAAAPPAPRLDLPKRLRVVYWNAERLTAVGTARDLLARAGADVVLLAEVDVGMARSGNRHTVAELAHGLGAGFLFGVEFVELDLGDERERARCAGQRNRDGLHGNAIVLTLPLARPALVRLETSGRWFDGRFGERRVGGRMALLAEVATSAGPVLLVSTHFESHTDPSDRAREMGVLLDAIDRHAPGMPALIGGDLNTSTFDLAGRRDTAGVVAAVATDPDRLVAPERWEPLFDLAARRGWSWTDANVAGLATQRTRADGTPAPPLGKIDWFLARGLRCSDPAVLPAVDARGMAVSDHELLAVTVEPEPRSVA
ncbi:MAG: endonuclease/exonuclease/phosphatase family protein [Geminicoccaceae bacterium]|nr:endonuclease/exonuclease/phosphatase family protein [Geminicoccaceae bacterium]